MTEPKTRILVVDDDLRLRDLLQRYLTEQGFGVHTVPDAAGMDKLLARERVDLLVLVLMLPGEDGLTICRRLRGGKNTVPIIMLTAKGEDVDRIVGLEMGADDYLPKPFNPRELVARINAVLRRRVAPLPPGAPAVEPEEVSFGSMTINLATRTLERDGQSLPLTTGEFALLKVLVTNPRTPLSRDKLMQLARGREYEVFDRSIDVQISRLRKLVEKDPAHPAYIQTVWGFGYVFVPDGRPQGLCLSCNERGDTSPRCSPKSEIKTLQVTLWPRSLLWRTFILLAILVIVTTVGWFQIFRSYERDPPASQISQNLISAVNLIRTALITSQPDKRRDLLSEIAERERIQVYPSEPGERAVPLPDLPSLRLVSEAVRKGLGRDTRFAIEREGQPGLWVSFHIDDDEYRSEER